MLENIDAIARRWAIKNNAKPDTARTYLSRVKSTLEDYRGYLASPTSFHFNIREVTAKKAPEKAPVEAT